MALFDKVIRKHAEFPGYRGNPPTTEQEYNSVDWFSDWQKPSWESVQAEITELETAETNAKKAAEAKLAKLGLTPEDLQVLLGVK
jgi:hypothetical protein